MKCTIAAAAAFAIPLAAQAADIRNDRYTTARISAPVGTTSSTIDRAGDSDWFKISLTAGHDYAVRFYADSGVSVAIRSPAGKVLKHTRSVGKEGDTGIEFRPSVTGTFYVEAYDDDQPNAYGPPIYYELGLAPDCRASTATHCGLKPGTNLTGRTCNWATDDDWYAMTLQAGRKYAFTAQTNVDVIPVFTELRSANGSKLASNGDYGASTIVFTPKASGTYYGVASCGSEDYGPGTYSVSLH